MTLSPSVDKRQFGITKHKHVVDNPDYTTPSEVDTISGTLQVQIDDNTALIATTSGTLQSEIDNMTTTHSGLTDMPSGDNADHDGRYYTQTEVDEIITTISGELDDHDELNNLDYASAGHTGFQPTGDYATNDKVDTTSGTLQDQLDEIPAGADTEIQFNDSGVLAGDSNFTWDSATQRLTALGDIQTDSNGTNTVIGVEALYNNSSGKYNTVIGCQTLYGAELDSPHYITAIGYRAMYTGGYFSVAIGYSASLYNADGWQNIAIGNEALRDNVNGWKNVAVGHRALYNRGLSDYNTAVGNEALGNSLGGERNTAIGCNAGYNSNGENGNVFIGYNAGYNESGDDKLYICNSDTATPLIYGEFDTPMVRINGDLDVTGDLTVDGTSPFQPTGDYATNAKVDTTSGTLQDQLDEIPAGADTEIQFNDNGVMGADSNFTWDSAAQRLTMYCDVKTGYPGPVAVDSDETTVFGVETIGSGVMTGRHNTAIGYRSMYNIEDGASNTAVGRKSMEDITSGNNNVGIGYNSLWNLTTGNSNVAVGIQAMGFGINTGHASIGVGVRASYNITSGDKNIGIGFYSLYQTTTGDNNIAIGEAALINNVAGSNNIAIGKYAGGAETGSNKLYIDNTSTANPLIYGEFDNDLVRINGDLDVTGNITVSGTAPFADTVHTHDDIYYRINFETITLDGTDISNKYVNLSIAPKTDDSLRLIVYGGTEGLVDTDYTVSGTTIDWNSKNWDGILVSGDIIKVTCWY